MNTTNFAYPSFASVSPMEGWIQHSGEHRIRELSSDELLLVSGGFWHILTGASQGAVGAGLGNFAAGLYQTGTLSGASAMGIAGMIAGGVGGGFTAVVNGHGR